LSNIKKGQAYILSAPAGTGKTTLVNRLTNEASHIVRNISYTTREIREGEKEGVDYHFISFQEFQHKINKGDFVEYAEVFGNFYGTDKTSVEILLNQGKDVVLVIDTQGAMAIKPFFKGVYIFMGPPSFEELEKRLRNRKTESSDDIETRLLWAQKEIEHAKQYDYNIVNCNLEKTYTVLKSIFIAEKYKVNK
jgi:guanylate kinase